jgi:hypothetical protein
MQGSRLRLRSVSGTWQTTCSISVATLHMSPNQVAGKVSHDRLLAHSLFQLPGRTSWGVRKHGGPERQPKRMVNMHTLQFASLISRNFIFVLILDYLFPTRQLASREKNQQIHAVDRLGRWSRTSRSTACAPNVPCDSPPQLLCLASKRSTLQRHFFSAPNLPLTTHHTRDDQAVYLIPCPSISLKTFGRCKYADTTTS